MFCSMDEEVDDEGEVVSSTFQGELEIMIAEPSARRKGYASTAIRCMVAQAKEIGVERLFVKVGDGNDASRDLFENKLGFNVVRFVEVFKEVRKEGALRGMETHTLTNQRHIFPTPLSKTELDLRDISGIAMECDTVPFSDPPNFTATLK